MDMGWIKVENGLKEASEICHKESASIRTRPEWVEIFHAWEASISLYSDPARTQPRTQPQQILHKQLLQASFVGLGPDYAPRIIVNKQSHIVYKFFLDIYSSTLTYLEIHPQNLLGLKSLPSS